MDNLEIARAVVCGLSFGGMVAQQFAVHHPDRLEALVLADTAVSVTLTLSDKLQSYIFFPKWAMQLTIRLLSVERFTRLSFWLARQTRSENWFGRDENTRQYVENCMLKMDQNEYLKIYGAIYEFRLLPLERIQCPTLVLNGEHESKAVFRHTKEILKRIPRSTAVVIPGAGHTSNMENADVFNQTLDEFLQRV